MLKEKKEPRLLVVANVSKEHIRKFHIPFINHMKSKGVIVDVACRMDAPVPECDSAYDLPCDRNPLRGGLWKSIMILRKIIKENRYDAVICNTLTGSIVARIASKTLGKRNAKVLYINHGLHFFRGASAARWLMGYPMEKVLIPLTDVLVTINDADFELAKESLKPRAIEKIHGIGVSLKAFRECELDGAEKSGLRQTVGLSEDDFVLVYVAEIIENKNQMMLVKMFQEVREIIPDAKMLLVGPEHDDGKLRTYIEKNGLGNSVLLLGWRSDVSKILRISDVYVASSKSEGLGLNLIEAMASNLPVVASRNRGHAEIIQHEQNGFLVDQDDSKEMAKYVLQIYEDPELRKRVVDQGQKDIEKFEIDEVIKEEERILYKYGFPKNH